MPASARGKTFIALGLLVVLGRYLPAAQIGDSTAELPAVVRVSSTFDNKPFDYRIESRTVKPKYYMYRLTYPSPLVTSVSQNNTIPAEYYLPRGIRPGDPARPAVICMHILDGDFVLVRLTCTMLASHGIPALMFKLPYYGERGFPEGARALAADPKLFTSALSQAAEDVRRTIDLLASRPEIDAAEIGITGISLGGIVAATAAGAEPRLNRVMLVLAGGDLNKLIHHARETDELSRMIKGLGVFKRAEIDARIRAVDPLRHAEGLKKRAQQGKVLMVNAAKDEVVPRACTEKLAAGIGIADEVVWLDGLGHYTAMAELPQILRMTVDFFKQDMPEGIEVPAPTARERTPQETVVSLMLQIATLLGIEPREGRCHFVEADAFVTLKDGESFEGRLRFIRGTGNRFNLDCDLPLVGAVAMGQDDYPWMASGGKTLFLGRNDSGKGPGNPLASADGEQILKLRVAVGAAAGFAFAPQLLDKWIGVEDATPENGPRTVRIVAKEKVRGTLDLTLKDDGQTPQQVAFDVDGIKGVLTFRGWQTDTVAHDAMFTRPDDLPIKEVSQSDLYRILSAMFNFAMESVE